MASHTAGALEDALLRVPGVASVSTKPAGRCARKLKPNDYGVSYKLPLPDGSQVSRRSACTEPGAADARSTLADALMAAIKSACTELGVDVNTVLNVPTVPSEPEPATLEELEWLQDWCESHPEPDKVTTELADAALKARRAGASGGASSSAASRGGSSAFAILKETQVLRAQVRAAERRAEAAEIDAERWRARLNEHVPKKPRVEHDDDQVTWRSWSISKWLELETKEQERRSEEVDVMKTEIVAPKQAGDDTRGWFRHWRRGLEGVDLEASTSHATTVQGRAAPMSRPNLMPHGRLTPPSSPPPSLLLLLTQLAGRT